MSEALKKLGGDGGGDIVWPWKLTVSPESEQDNHPPPVSLASDVFPPSACAYPVLVRELLGHPCRLIAPGTVVTEDFRPERVNFVVDEQGVIKDIRFG